MKAFIGGPILHNFTMGVLVFFYVKGLVWTCDYLVERKKLSYLQARKIVHLGVSCYIMFWHLFDDSHWSYRFNGISCDAYMFDLVYKGYFKLDPNDPEVKAVTRTGKPQELLAGPLLFILVLVYSCNFLFMQELPTYMFGAMGFGDGIAPIVGTNFPIGRYKSLGEDKTLSGSLTMFLGTIGGIHLFSYVLGTPESLEWGRVIGVAVVATLAEGVSGVYDNMVVALSVALFIAMTTATNAEVLLQEL